MRTRLLAGWVLFILGLSGMTSAQDPVTDYSSRFTDHTRFESCRNTYEGVFVSVADGCASLELKLVFRVLSLHKMHHPKAARYCGLVDKMADRVQQPLGWRLPTGEELRDLKKELEFVAISSGLEYEEHTKQGMGILPFDLNQTVWLSETKTGSYDYKPWTYGYDYSLATGQSELQCIDPLIKRGRLYSLNDSMRGQQYTANFASRGMAHALCVRELNEDEDESEEHTEPPPVPSVNQTPEFDP